MDIGMVKADRASFHQPLGHKVLGNVRDAGPGANAVSVNEAADRLSAGFSVEPIHTDHYASNIGLYRYLVTAMG
jgi:hypothetical protein